MTVAVERPRPVPSARERALGLEFYVTEGPGIDGILKERPDDFRVNEISAYPRPDPEGAFTVLRVASRDWEQHELSQRLAARLGLRPNALAWAGTKDRRAVAERLVSYRGLPPTGPIDLPGATVLEQYRARTGLVLGHHYGNAFFVRVRLAPGVAPDAAERAGAIHDELRRLGGCANLFGPQRFGEVRPITHEVGRALVRGDPGRAVDLYLTEIPDGPAAVGDAARRTYAETHDALRALREFPAHYRFERQMLDHLARGQPPERALRALSRELRMLFVHAYQALLFNRWVSRRHARGLSLLEPVEGDHLLRVTRDGTVPGVDPIPVSADNLPEASDLVRRSRARLAGPLVGLETPALAGEPGEILEGLLAEEAVRRADFGLPRFPEIASLGSWRPVWLPLPPIAVRTVAPGEGTPDGALDLVFSLPKGAYATVLLREFLKTGSRPGASRGQFSNT